MQIDNFNIYEYDIPYFIVGKVKYYIGTTITRKSTSGLIKHFGVFIGYKNNKYLILHFDKRGVLIEDIKEFLKTKDGIVNKTFDIVYPIYSYNNDILKNIDNSLKNNKNLKFHSILNNCEMFIENTVFQQNNYSKFSKLSIILDIIILLNNLSNNRYSLKYFNKSIKNIYKIL